MRSVVLVVPSLSLLDEPDIRDRAREFPLLARLFSRATRIPRAGPLEPDVLSALGLRPDLSLATITAAADLAATPFTGAVLRCDPIHLHADPQKVLVDARVDLSPEESAALVTSLRGDFPELALQAGRSPLRWYLRQPPDLSGRAPSTQWLHGRSLSPFMPAAAADRPWRRYLNDFQMALHAHPLNAARSARGVLPINAVWWFGAGAFPDIAPVQDWRLAGDDVLLAGLARLFGYAHERQPDPRWGEAAPRFLLVAGEAFGEMEGRGQGVDLATLETRFLPRLWSDLRRGRVADIEVITGTHRARLTPFRAWCGLRQSHGFRLA